MMKVVVFFLLMSVHLVISISLRHRKLERVLAENRIDEEYIVVFREGIDVQSKAGKLKEQLPDIQIHFSYDDDTFRGLSLGKVTEWQLSELLDDPDVLFIEEVTSFQVQDSILLSQGYEQH